jgi:hypothetical protein
LILFFICLSNILCTQLDIARKSKSKSKSRRSRTKTREVNFSDWTNLTYLLGGFISHYFGFYEEFKNAQATYTCVQTSIPIVQKAATDAFAEITKNLNTVMSTCKQSNPLDFIFGAVRDVLQIKDSNIDKLADDLLKNTGCYNAAKALADTAIGIIKKIKDLIAQFKKCIEDFNKNQSTKPSWITKLMIDTAVKVGTALANLATGGAIDAAKVGQAILIMIKFGIVCAYSDKDFAPIHKYRVLGKYLSQLLQLVPGFRRIRRRLKYRIYKHKMMKYKN